jgi:hypothetical protein
MSADRTPGRAHAKPSSSGPRPTDKVAYPRRERSPRADDVTDEAFNLWLDEKLREIYRATQNEPLPQEMLDLLQRMFRSPVR